VEDGVAGFVGEICEDNHILVREQPGLAALLPKRRTRQRPK
jgi:hypothetical protein